ncbi:hypothetical protein OSB04_027640 [Centaurea solstitialis]|uniref:Retrotransposon gag domain-containing protein n=1 Tax=Centaurea solstitialis TaxID=347529 RepID=A0AA38SFP9_9ASTR|nr:hypothetical protein OSB04_027640 [Centaurea solstitialis]
MLRKQKEPLLEIDPEIEKKTFRKRRRGKKKSQPSVEPVVVPTVIMADLPPPVHTTVHIADDKDRKIRDYATPGADQFASGIPRPDANNRFELKPVMFQMLQTMGQFGGSTAEDPHAHLKSFLEVADSFHIPGVAEDAVRLKLFPFTLRDRAKAWINSFRPNSLITWNVLAEKFLQKYFPPTRNVKLRNDIILFRQGDDETVSEAWERFKELLRQCPHHGIPHCIQLETFYNGLTNAAKLILDATAGGAFTSQTYNEGYQILEKVANNNTGWSNPWELTPKINPSESDTLKAINAQLAALTKLVLDGNRQQVNSAVATPQLPDSCTWCGEDHIFDYCPGNPEAVNVIGTQHRDSPFSQTYNSNWRHHPNFSWRDNQGSHPPGMNQGPNRAARPPFTPQSQYHQGQSSHFHSTHTPSGHAPQNFHQGQPPQNFQQRQQPALEAPPSIESVLKGFMNQTQAAIRNIETQVGQLAAEVKNRPQGNLPSDTEHPKRGGKSRAAMSSCKPCVTPVDTSSKLSASDGTLLADGTQYRSLAGALQYLTFTRPDIAYAVQQICLFMHAPREPHFAFMKRILRYIQGTLDHGLRIHVSRAQSLTAYSDADWGGCPDSRRSTSGYCIFLGDNLVSWSSKRQPTISRSSAEAEHRGVANTVAEASWLRNLLLELHVPISKATVVYCDNVYAIYLTQNPVQHQRTKHVEIDIHFVREKVQIGHIRVLHVPSSSQFADIFTKGLPRQLFQHFRFSLNVRSPTVQTAGDY